MTAGDPLSLGPSAALADADTEGCLCLVTGYAKTNGLIARVTAEAEKRVMMSPTLGDFLQLRYLDLGPQPGQAGDRSRPVRRIVADLMTVRETAGRSRFALIVIAKSAMTIEGLLSSCAADPFLSGLRMRFAGIANSDDRQQGAGFTDITSSPAGSWRTERQLIDALRQRCEELPRYFAVRGEPGLTSAELAALRQARGYPALDDGGPRADEGGTPDEPVSDVLDDAPETGAPGSGGTVWDQDAVRAGSAGSVPAGSVLGRLTAGSVARRLPTAPWRRGRQAANPGDASSPLAAMGLVYLLVVVDQNAAGDPASGPLQAALLDLDRRLAAQPFRGIQVRLIHGSDGDLRGELRDAGSLGRRAAKRSVRAGDFAAVLKGIRSSLRRDRGLVQTIAKGAGLTVSPVAVVIFTADPPMADLAAAAAFGDLAAEATVVWVVPGGLEGLVSPAFGTACGAAVLGEHEAVAGEVLDVMHDGVSAS